MESDIESLTAEFVEKLFVYIKEGLPSVIGIIAIIYLSVFVSSLLKNEATGGDIVLMCIICAISVPIASQLSRVIEIADTTLNDMTVISLGTIPSLTSLTFAGKGPLFLLVIQLCGVLIDKAFMPLTIIYACLGIVSSVSRQFSCESIKGMVKSAYTWGLGIMMLVFSFVSAISGVISGINGGIALRSIKYAGSMVPLVGRYIAESSDMVFASGSAMKSTLGLGAAIAILSTCLAPLARMLSYVLLYRIVDFVIAPVAHESIRAVIRTVNEVLSMITGLCALMCIMCIIDIGVIISAAIPRV